MNNLIDYLENVHIARGGSLSRDFTSLQVNYGVGRGDFGVSVGFSGWTRQGRGETVELAVEDALSNFKKLGFTVLYSV